MDGRQLSALGVGTWALGGPWTFDGRDAGWGEVDDAVSVTALHAVIDHGVRLIDTASAYGTGHSERVIGRALAELPSSIRDEIVVATKFGLVVDEQSRSGGGEDVPRGCPSPSAPTACGGSGGTASTSCSCTVVPRVWPQPRTWWRLSRSSSARARSGLRHRPGHAETVAVFARSAGCLAARPRSTSSAGPRPRWCRTRPRAGRVGPVAAGHGYAAGKYDAHQAAQGRRRPTDTPGWDYFDHYSCRAGCADSILSGSC